MARVAIIHRGRLFGTPWEHSTKDVLDIKSMILEGITLVVPHFATAVHGQSVFVKVNAVRPHPTLSFTTDPRVLEAIVEILKDSGARKIMIGDNSTVDVRTRLAIVNLGLDRIAKRLGVTIQPLDEDETIRVRNDKAYLFREFTVPKTLLDVDLIVNLPKMKTHVQTLVSLAIKNHHGFCVKEERLLCHREDLNQKLVDIYAYFKEKEILHIIDGIWAIEGQGPCDQGKQVKDFNIIVAGKDAVAVDGVGSYLMGIEPREVAAVRIGSFMGLGEGDLDRIEIVGANPHLVRRYFERPICGVAGFFPGVRALEFGVCKGCQNHAQVSLEIMRDERELEKLPSNIILFLGKPQSGVNVPLDDNADVWLFGDCAAELLEDLKKRKARTHFVPGDPPWLADLRDALKAYYKI